MVKAFCFLNFSYFLNTIFLFLLLYRRKRKATQERRALASTLRDSATGVIVKRLTADSAMVALYGGEMQVTWLVAVKRRPGTLLWLSVVAP